MNKIVIWFVLLFLASPAHASWSCLCSQVSKVNFVTVQNNKLTEVHLFTNMEGTISDEGRVFFNIDLSSVQTNNSLRNLRLQDIFFETLKFPEATVTLDLNNDFLSQLKIDKANKVPVQASLFLHGITKNIETVLLVTRLKSGCLIVTSMDPIVISLKDFDLLNNLEKIRQLANLESISKTVTISVNLFFIKD